MIHLCVSRLNKSAELPCYRTKFRSSHSSLALLQPTLTRDVRILIKIKTSKSLKMDWILFWWGMIGEHVSNKQIIGMNLNWIKMLNSQIFVNQSCGNVQNFGLAGNYHHIHWPPTHRRPCLALLMFTPCRNITTSLSHEIFSQLNNSASL